MDDPVIDLQPRKSPRQRRSAMVVESIYEAAARILEGSGLADLNTNAVAERAGVSVGSLYQYFPSKEAILAGLLRRKRSELLSEIRFVAANYATKTFEDTVDALLTAALRHQLERPGLARTLEYAEAILPIDEETRVLKAEIAREIARVLHERGFDDADRSARDITALARGMIDAAGLAGETDAAALAIRVRAAVLGYLDRMAGLGNH